MASMFLWMPDMRVLITGSQGIIDKNQVVRLRELPGYEVVCF